MKSIGEIVGPGELGELIERTARESDRQESEARMQGFWKMAVEHSKKLFGGRRLWKVILVESRTREIVVKSDVLRKEEDAIRQQKDATTIARNEPIACKYFVRYRVVKGEPAEWVEAVYDYVDPLDYNSPRAWQLRFDKKQKSRRAYV